MNNGNSNLPVGKILAGMGIFTAILSAGIFFGITGFQSDGNTANVAEAASHSAPDEAVGEEAESRDPSLPDIDLSGPPPKPQDNQAENSGQLKDRNVQVDQVSDAQTAPESGASKTPEMEAPAGEEPPVVSQSTDEVANVEGVRAIAPNAHSDWLTMMDLPATLEGVVQKEHQSKSGKTFYLYFSNDRNDTMVYMLKREVPVDLNLDYLGSLVGKRVRVTGRVERQFGTGRVGVRVKSKEQIEVVE